LEEKSPEIRGMEQVFMGWVDAFPVTQTKCQITDEKLKLLTTQTM